MKIRRLGALVISVTLLQLGVVRSGVCDSRPLTPAAGEHHPTSHHDDTGKHGGDHQPGDCDESGDKDCCATVAACGLVLGEPSDGVAVEPSGLYSFGAPPAAARLFSVTTAPEPPPPKA